MPNTASGLTELSAGDPLIPVLGRIQEHPLQGYALGRLNVGPLGDRHPRRGQAVSQLITNTLELAQGQDPGVSSPRRARLRKPTHRVRGHERTGQLTLQPGDLGSHRPTAGEFVRPAKVEAYLT
jgi:hypothetical protein